MNDETRDQPGHLASQHRSHSAVMNTTGLPTLRQVRKEFPQFVIWREMTSVRTRYIARARDLQHNPHTVVTADLAELRDALAGTAPDQADGSGQAEPGEPAPSIARMYSYLTAGKDHVAIDRDTADSVLAEFPEVAQIARANREFVTKAVALIAAEGITTFVDVGAGLPTWLNVHEVAQQVNPAALTCYVDSDEMVLVHARALLEAGPRVTVAQGDLRDPAGILAHPVLTTVVNWNRPVCLILASVLHFLTPVEADTAVATLTAALVPGSYLIASAGTSTGTDPVLLERLTTAYAKTSVVTARTEPEIAGWFTGFDLIPPGLVDVRDWHTPRIPGPSWARFLAGVGRKPCPAPVLPRRTHLRSPGGWR